MSVLWVLMATSAFLLDGCGSVLDRCIIYPLEKSGGKIILDVGCRGPWPEFSKQSFPHATNTNGLVFTDCNFTVVPRRAFQIFNDLQRLFVMCNRSVPELRFEAGSLAFVPKMETIVISSNHLKLLPPDLFCGLPSLNRVFLNDNDVENPDMLGLGLQCSENRTCSPTLKILSLKENPISHLPNRTFCSLTMLSTLDISYCGMQSIDEDAFYNLGALKSLDISDNSLTTIPEMAMIHLTSIYTLDLANNPSLNISGFLQHMPTLKGLYLPNTGLEHLNANSFKGLSKVESLMLYKNGFQNIDREVFTPLIGEPDDLAPGVCEEDAIQRLSIGGEIEFLTKELDKVANVTGLRYLNLGFNDFDAIPAVGMLFKLQIFSIANNRITALRDDDVSGLRRLQLLNLAFNRIEIVNDRVFRNLSCLKQLLLNNNAIESIDPSAFRDNVALLDLYLQDNRISNINGLFGTNVRLQRLDLSNNRLESISFDAIPLSVQELNVSSNLLKVVDAHSGTFPPNLRLRILDLSWNRFGSVTSTMFPLSLSNLFLHGNLLTDVANCAFCNLGVVKNITLHDNRLQTVLPEALRVSVSLNLQLSPTVTLLGNPFVCDCRMQDFLHDVIEAGHMIIQNFNNLPCVRRFSRGRVPDIRIVQAVAPEDFLCPVEHSQNRTIPPSCVVYHDLGWHFLAVDCSNQNLTEVPRNLLPQTAELFLDGNRLGRLMTSALGSLPRVTKLYLNGSALENIEGRSFAGLTNLSLLHLEGNQLTALDGDTFAGLTKLTELHLQSNRLKHISEDTFQSLVKLKILKLHGNKIDLFPVWKLRNLPFLQSISLSQNPWSCACDFVQGYREWLQEFAPKVADINSLYCKFDDDSVSEVPLIAYNASYCYSTAEISFVRTKYFSLLTSLVTLLALFAIGAAFLFLYRREIQVLVYSRYGVRLFHKDAKAADRGKIFDAFLCYSGNDEAFVVEELLPKLEGIDPPYSLCIHQRDFMVGGFITNNILEAVSKSRRTILLLSENFVLSEFCRFEFKTAYVQMLRDRCNRAIVVVLGDIPKDLGPEMELYLKTNTYITWGDKLFWERLYFAMPNRIQVS